MPMAAKGATVAEDREVASGAMDVDNLIVEIPDLVTSVVLGIWRRGGRIYSLRTCIFLSVHLHSPQNHDF